MNQATYTMAVTLLNALALANATEEFASQRDGVFGSLVEAIKRLKSPGANMMFDYWCETSETLTHEIVVANIEALRQIPTATDAQLARMEDDRDLIRETIWAVEAEQDKREDWNAHGQHGRDCGCQLC